MIEEIIQGMIACLLLFSFRLQECDVHQPHLAGMAELVQITKAKGSGTSPSMLVGALCFICVWSRMWIYMSLQHMPGTNIVGKVRYPMKPYGLAGKQCMGYMGCQLTQSSTRYVRFHSFGTASFLVRYFSFPG